MRALPDDPDKLLTGVELAEILGVPANSVRKWPSQGKGPRRLQIGRHIRYRMGDVRTWLEAQYVD